MNDEHELRADRDPAARSNEELARLARIEKQLKKARPRAPSLNAAALERVAFLTEAEPVVQRATNAATLRRLRWDRRRYRRIAAVAGSWACGAVVGALLTFFAMSRTEPARDAANQTAAQTEGRAAATIQPEPARVAKRQPQRGANPMEASSPGRPQRVAEDDALVALLADPFGNGDSTYGFSGPTLRAGIHLSQYPENARKTQQAPGGAALPRTPQDERQRAESPSGREEDRNPRPEITRERLLREFLLETPGSVL